MSSFHQIDIKPDVRVYSMACDVTNAWPAERKLTISTKWNGRLPGKTLVDAIRNDSFTFFSARFINLFNFITLHELLVANLDGQTEMGRFARY